MKKCRFIPALGAVMTLCASCSDEVPAIPDSELYTRAFVKEFGVVNPAQDWNAATASGVNVTTDAPARVQVTCKIQGTDYLLADYADVSGTRNLKFDIPKSVKEVTVICGDERVKTTLGGSVSFANAGRTVLKTGSTNVTAELCTDPKDWMVVPWLNATIFRRKMPEKCYNANRENVSVDFTYKFTKNDIIVRPLYWQTKNTLEFGFFCLDENGKPIHFPIYNMERNTESADVNSLALCWAPTEVKKLTVKDFLHDETFVECMKEQGLDIVEKTWEEWNHVWKYNYPDVTTLDNFAEKTDEHDDRMMTFACRSYLEKQGILNDPNQDEEHRFNYVYRWRMVGNRIKTIGDVEGAYDGSLISQDKYPKEDLEIIYTYYNYDYSAAKGWKNDIDMGSGITMNDDNYPALISKGIKVHFEDLSKTYGGYVKRDERYLYSVSSLNEKNRWAPKEGAVREYTTEFGGQWVYKADDFEIVEGKKAFRAATWEGKKYNWRYMSFEDGVIGDTYNRDNCDFDMQDFVFIIDGVEPSYDTPPVEVVDQEKPKPQPIKWLIACEDLGNKDDFDFNDVVFEVEHVSGTKELKITPLAAGGTLETYLYLDDRQIGGEWHGNWGVSTTTMHNTTSFSGAADPIIITVDDNFSLSVFNADATETTGTTNYGDKNMGGFSLKVGGNGADVEKNVTAPGLGEAPQMLLIFQPEATPWRWPLERHNIRVAFPDFEQWMKNATYDIDTKGGNWSENHAESHVIKR